MPIFISILALMKVGDGSLLEEKGYRDALTVPVQASPVVAAFPNSVIFGQSDWRESFHCLL
jgi:hypothetical protein